MTASMRTAPTPNAMMSVGARFEPARRTSPRAVDDAGRSPTVAVAVGDPVSPDAGAGVGLFAGESGNGCQSSTESPCGSACAIPGAIVPVAPLHAPKSARTRVTLIHKFASS